MSSRYRLVRLHGHPKASPVGQVSEHVVVAEAAFGKYLPDGAVIHHVNGNPRDNRPSNLVICQDSAYHSLLHLRQRIYRAGGNPNTHRLCCHCKQLVLIEQMSKPSPKAIKVTSICKACRLLTGRQSYDRRNVHRKRRAGPHKPRGFDADLLWCELANESEKVSA